MGTKAGVWAHWLFDAGLAMVCYTDFNHYNVKMRPELGVGMSRFRLVFGYNVPTINNKAFKELQKNNVQVCMQVTIGVKKRKIRYRSNIT